MKYPVYLPKSTCDVLKFAAALIVLSAHMASAALGPRYGSQHWFFYAMASQNGYIGVAVFFFLSGYGLMESELKSHLDLKSFFKRRFLKVFLPVLLVTALWLPILYRTAPNLIDCKSIIYDLTFGFADPVMWYIRILFILYVAFFLMTLIMQIGHRTAAVWLLFGGLMFFSMFYFSTDSIQKHSVPLFAIGVVTSYYKKQYGIRWFALLTLTIGAIIGIGAYFMTSHPLTGFIHVFFDYIAITLLVAFISIRHIKWQIPVILTAISFDIYLIHFKLIEIISLWVPLSWFLVLLLPLTLISSYGFMKLRSTVIDNGIFKLFNLNK